MVDLRHGLRRVSDECQYALLNLFVVLTILVCGPPLIAIFWFAEVSLRRARPFDVLYREMSGVSHASGPAVVVALTPLGGGGPFDVVEVRRDARGRVDTLRVVEYPSAGRLFERYAPCALIAWSLRARAKVGPAELLGWAAELAAELAASGRGRHWQTEQLARLQRRFERPARVVQRAWRAWRARRLQARLRAVAAIEAAALHAMYRPGGWSAGRLKADFDSAASQAAQGQ
jgi:hypothetical protein